ncbi:hypothetical protein NKR19_g134 [Coniochaeta hoffmannii]|uniref:Uncharacterized protein n=1 Tax=Coniochaeta hoffmannii TaxID=91930 RepID=A0AA38S343_9PEZI|nr:hypothetical protein NKR19_g134 [Coniochaeta hoffmannii]
MITTTTPTPTPPPTSTPLPPPPPPSSSSALTPEQIAGVVVGVFIFLLLLVLLAFLLRWLIRRRRSRLAAARQQITPPGSGPNPPPGGGVGGGGGDSTSLSASGLTGENEVRIVIRPPAPPRQGRVPSRGGRGGQWPMPPGHRGQTYSFFVEDTTTGESTPQRAGAGLGGGDPATWSIASERGSPRGTQSGTGTQSGSEGVGGSGLISVGWGSSSLSPPEGGWRGQPGARGGGAGGSGGYPQGSLGIGKAF